MPRRARDRPRRLAQLDAGKPAEAVVALTRFVTIAPATMADQLADAKRRLASLSQAK